MLKTHTQILTISLGLLGSASAVTTLIDFGRADNTTGSNYNNATFAAVTLNDTAGAATGWTINVTENGNGNGGTAGGGADVSTFPAAVSGFETTALEDSLFANGTSASMTVVISGLDPAATYDLLFYGSRSNFQNKSQTWTLTTGSGGAAVNHNSLANTATAVDWAGTTNVAGTIEFTITGGPPAGALALNFGSITEIAPVPEPSSALLLALAGLSLLGRRHR